MIFIRKRSFFLFFCFLGLNTSLLFAQIAPIPTPPTQATAIPLPGPDFIFRIRTNDGYGGPFPTWTTVNSSWDNSYSDPLGNLNRTSEFSGSVTRDSLSLSSTSEQSGAENISSGVASTMDAKYELKIFVRDPATISLHAVTSADVENDSSAQGWRSASYGPIPYGSTFLEAYIATGSGHVTDHYGDSADFMYDPTCTPSGATTFPGYPNDVYYPAYSGAVGSFTTANGPYFSGLLSSDGTTTYTASKGSDDPIAQIDGPYVSGQIKDNPDINDTVDLVNTSYDPDDDHLLLTSICDAEWIVTAPDGVVSTYDLPMHLSGISFPVSKPGLWTVDLTVVDNEGDEGTTSMSFRVGDPRKPHPDGDNSPCYSENGGWFGAGVNASSGNAHLSISDPVSTRGYPIRCNIHINTQSHFPSRLTPMKNATFSYNIEVYQGVVNTPSGPETHWFLIDGDGAEFDFGIVSSAPVAPPGVFSTLSQVTGGFTLSGAAEPETIEKAGNFSYEFNNSGKLTKITDPAGNEQIIAYNGDGTPSSVLDQSSNKTLSFEYDVSGTIARLVENGAGATNHLGYVDNKLTNVTLKDPSSIVVRYIDITYDEDGLIDTVRLDGDVDRTLTFSYQNAGDGIKLANINHFEGNTNYNYSVAPPVGASWRTEHTNSKGETTFYDFDDNFNLLELTTPILHGSSQAPHYNFGYDANFNMTSSSNGATTYTMGYTSNGLLERVEDQTGRFRQYYYSGADLTKVEDNGGTIIEYLYNNVSLPHHPTDIKDGAGNTWIHTYNSYGQVTHITPPTSSPQNQYVYTYDETPASATYGYLKTITSGAGENTDIDSYSLFGDITSITTSPEIGTTNTITYEYDVAQRLRKVIFDDTKDIKYRYTGRDLDRITDEAGVESFFGYCEACGKLSDAQLPLSKNLDWNVDTDFDVSDFTDPRYYITNYKYGLAKELKEVSYPDGSFIKYTYDSYGRIKTTTNSRNDVGTLSYNGSGDIESISYGTGHSDNLGYTYYPNGLLHTLTSNVSIITYTYTTDHQIDTVTYDYSIKGLTALQVVDYTYHTDGLIDTIEWLNGGSSVATWIFGYDAAGKINSISSSLGELATYIYDDEGKIETQTNGNGTVTDYEYYEPRNWPDKITHSLSSVPFAEYALTFDDGLNTVGNITDVLELDGSIVEYGYDGLYRLETEDRTGTNPYSKSYGYDVAGNVTSLDGQYFASHNEVNEIDDLAVGHAYSDADGNLYDVTGQSVRPEGSFYFNARNTLIRATNSLSNIGYRIDGHGRRAYATERCYIFHGDKVIGEIDLSAVPQMSYTWGPDGLVSEHIHSSGVSRYYHFGPQGETRFLTNSTGSVTDSYLYSAYGVPISSTGSSTNYHKYGGKHGYYTEGTTGIMLVGARAYHPYLIRWLQRDPIRYEGGTNLYEYVKGNPVTHVDPDGLLEVDNRTEKPIPYKPEGKNNVVEFCMPGQPCDMDGWYPEGSMAPEKLMDYICYGMSITDCKKPASGFCLPGGRWPLSPDFFEEHPDWPNPYDGTGGWPGGHQPGGLPEKPK